MHKILFKFICTFLASTAVCMFCAQSLNDKSYVVPGTVFSKDTEQYAYGKHLRKMSTRYIICVHPNDTDKFKNYSMYVDYETFCTHDVGDKITFSVSENKCLRDFKRSIWVEEFIFIVFILFAILSLFSLACIIAMIVEALI